MMRFVPLSFCMLLLCTFSSADTLHLRNGEQLDGRVLGERDGVYTVQENGSPRVQRISKKAVKFVLYDDPRQAEQRLALDHAAKLGRNPSLASVDVLPAEAFGSAIIDAVREAEESIWITIYLLSRSKSGTIKEFYDLLSEKAHTGVEVVIICEFSSATSPAIRNATLNRVQELANEGITVLFIQEYKSMHKKMIVVDGRIVLLGSSNLSLAGTRSSNEMNVRVRSEFFAQSAISDFKRLRERAKPARELK